MSNLIKLYTSTIGLICLTMGLLLIEQIISKKVTLEESPTGYIFSLIIAPILLLLGWRIILRRYWAGVLLAVLFAIGEFDWITRPRMKTTAIDVLWLCMFIMVVISVTRWRDQWIFKL